RRAVFPRDERGCAGQYLCTDRRARAHRCRGTSLRQLHAALPAADRTRDHGAAHGVGGAREPIREGAMSFARPDLLPLVFIIPLLLAGAIWLYARRRVRIARAFSDAHLLSRLGGDELLRFPLPRLVLLVLAGASAGMAAAGPRWGYETAEGQSLSLNIVVATDISKSMLVPDVEPNRLERSRLFARRMLRELPGDRFGLVVFAGRAYILSPLTSDHSALELYLDALDPEMVSQGGSSLAAAIAQATDLVRGSETGAGDRAVVLLSDGEALEDAGGVEAAADR